MTRVLEHSAEPVAHGDAPGGGLQHLPSLDGLRGIAVLAVVVFHFSPEVAPGGFLGVDIFFVLSGFLITSLLVSERERTQRISLRSFWLRRARRLLPALFLLLIVLGAYALLSASEVDANQIGEDGLAALGYVANWHFIVSGQGYVEQFLASSPSPFRHTWSLAIEEQFYVIWPLIVAGVGVLVARGIARPGRSRRRLRTALAVLCLVLGVISLGLMVTLFDEGDPNRVYYGTDTRAFLLLLGAAVGALTAGRLTITRTSLRTLLVVAGTVAAVGVGVLLATVETTDIWLYQGGYGIVAVLVALVLAAAAQPGLNPLGYALRAKPLVWLGLISYGVYLWHWPISLWLTEQETSLDGPALFALRSVVTLTIAIASYFVVEQPIRRGNLRVWTSKPRRVAVAAAVLAGAVLVVPALTFASTVPPPKVKPTKQSEEVADTYKTVPRCDGKLTTPRPDRVGVPPREPAGDKPIVQLVGNSIAIEVAPCLAKIVENHGGAFESVSGAAQQACSFLPTIREQLANPETRPTVAVWFTFDWYYLVNSCNGDWKQAPQEAIRIYAEAGVHLYLVSPPPRITPSPIPGVLQFEKDGVVVDAPAQTAEFQAWAAQNPEHVTWVDAGLFIRDATGAYQYRMPCLHKNEVGCAEDGTIGVRFTDEFHFCSDPTYDGINCPPEHSGGQRRVAAAIALQIEELRRWKAAMPPADVRAAPPRASVGGTRSCARCVVR